MTGRRLDLLDETAARCPFNGYWRSLSFSRPWRLDRQRRAMARWMRVCVYIPRARFEDLSIEVFVMVGDFPAIEVALSPTPTPLSADPVDVADAAHEAAGVVR